MVHLITGGSGFLGSNLAHYLHSRGEKVRLIDIVEPLDYPETIDFLRCNILDREAVRRAMQGVDYVYHCAALVPVSKSGADFYKINIEGTKIATELAYEAGVKMFVYISSSAVFAGSLDRCPLREDTPSNPIEIYGYSKRAAEECVLKAQKRGLSSTIIRPRCILGRGRLGVLHMLFDWIYGAKKVYMLGDGNQLFQLIHVDDVVKACILCTEREKVGIYNIGTDRYSTLREDLTSLIRYAGTDSRIARLPVTVTVPILRTLDLLHLSPLASFHYHTYGKPFYFDISKAINELSWKPKYSNTQMLVESYDWFVTNYDRMKANRIYSSNLAPVKQGILKLVKMIS